jgi:tRNA pseudouridine55 synthase
LRQFEGEILQKPHKYSAVKIDGQRAYKAARAGKTVEIEPRKVKIYEITDVKYEYPKLNFICKVSTGTYIRSLAEDIGAALGTGAYLSALRRTQVGSYMIENALEQEDFDYKSLLGHLVN